MPGHSVFSSTQPEKRQRERGGESPPPPLTVACRRWLVITARKRQTISFRASATAIVSGGRARMQTARLGAAATRRFASGRLNFDGDQREQRDAEEKRRSLLHFRSSVVVAIVEMRDEARRECRCEACRALAAAAVAVAWLVDGRRATAAANVSAAHRQLHQHASACAAATTPFIIN